MRESLEQLRLNLGMVARRRWVAVIATAVFCAMGWGVLHFVIPDMYQVKATVYLDTKVALKPLFSSLTGGEAWNPEQSAMLIKRTLFTREHIERIIHETGLDKKIDSPRKLEKSIKGLAAAIHLERVLPALDENSDYGTPASDIYAVSYTLHDPVIATKVVESVVNLFIERMGALTRSEAEEAGDFLQTEITEYARSLGEAEERLKQFKLANPGVSLEPGRDTYTDRVRDLQREHERAKLSLREAEFRAQALRRQIDSLAVAAGASSTGGGLAGPTSLDLRIQALEEKLSDQLTNFTEAHPEVIGTKRALETLREQKRKGLDRQPGATGAVAAPAAFPVDAGPRLLLAEAEAAAGALREQVADYERQLEDLKPLAGQLPEAEAELAKLNRDYDVIKETYAQLVQKREAIQLSQQSAGSSLVKVLDAPRVPLIPISPNRIFVTTMILAVSAALGIALAWFLSQANPVVYTRQQLSAFSGLPVLGTVTRERSALEMARRGAGMVMYAAAVTGVLVGYGVMQSNNGYDFTKFPKMVESVREMIL